MEREPVGGVADTKPRLHVSVLSSAAVVGGSAKATSADGAGHRQAIGSSASTAGAMVRWTMPGLPTPPLVRPKVSTKRESSSMTVRYPGDLRRVRRNGPLSETSRATDHRRDLRPSFPAGLADRFPHSSLALNSWNRVERPHRQGRARFIFLLGAHMRPVIQNQRFLDHKVAFDGDSALVLDSTFTGCSMQGAILTDAVILRCQFSDGSLYWGHMFRTVFLSVP